jgi:hypothetical protein
MGLITKIFNCLLVITFISAQVEYAYVEYFCSMKSACVTKTVLYDDKCDNSSCPHGQSNNNVISETTQTISGISCFHVHTISKSVADHFTETTKFLHYDLHTTVQHSVSLHRILYDNRLVNIISSVSSPPDPLTLQENFRI